jgi:hypothetical protein
LAQKAFLHWKKCNGALQIFPAGRAPAAARSHPAGRLCDYLRMRCKFYAAGGVGKGSAEAGATQLCGALTHPPHRSK